MEGLEPVSTKREQDLPGNEMEFTEFIGGAINSVRAAFSNNVVRTINTVTNDAISNKYEVNSSGQLVLVTGVPKESFTEKVVNGSFDLATLALAAAGGPEGVLTAQGGKTPIIKGIEEVKALSKLEARAAKLSLKQRPGMDATKAGKSATVDLNKAKNKGKTICETCSIETIPAKKDAKGVTPPLNRTEIDHIEKRREGGSGTPDNLRLRCRGCNNKDR